MRILIVEDEARVAADIAAAVKAQGFVPEILNNGEEAWFSGSTEPYGAIILDIGLPGMDGMSVLKQWRKEGLTTPVIMLTARGSWSERVDGIDAGADDYLPKPFRMEELMARVRALVRRSSGNAQPRLTVGTLSLDQKACQASLDGTPIALTPLEYRLLNYLVLNRDRVVSQSELSDNLYAVNSERDSNAIEALVRRLRKKLKEDLIETRRGFGYCIRQDAS
jgi:DNA-binding response OmpR family regulator